MNTGQFTYAISDIEDVPLWGEYVRGVSTHKSLAHVAGRFAEVSCGRFEFDRRAITFACRIVHCVRDGVAGFVGHRLLRTSSL